MIDLTIHEKTLASAAAQAKNTVDSHPYLQGDA